MEKVNEMIQFVDGNLYLDVTVTPEKDTVWLTQEQMAMLFDVDRTRITRHINNIYNEGELEKKSTCAENAHMGTLGKQVYKRNLYNLDIIISVGYRVKSKRGIQFRKWATQVLKDYMLKGYAINSKRLEVLNRTVEIQNNIIAGFVEMTGMEAKDVLEVVETYSMALNLLDDYDQYRHV